VGGVISKTQIRGVEQILATSVDLTAEVTNTLPVGNGGTGAVNLGSNTVLLGNGTASVNSVAPSSAGNVLVDTGSTWVSAALPTALTGIITGNGSVFGSVAAPTGTVVGTSDTQTLTNKRITSRVLALSANSATPAVNTDNYDVVHITGQTATITGFTMTGSPVDGDLLLISITGTAAVPFTLGSSFEASTVALSTTTVTTARLDMGFFWNTATSKWRQVAAA